MATCCSWLVFLAPRTLRVEPSRPLRIRSRCSGRNVPLPSPSSCCSWPSFSASVIFASKASICLSTFFCCCEREGGAGAIKNRKTSTGISPRRMNLIRFILFLPKRFFAGSGVRVEPGVLRPGKGFLFCRRDNDELAFQSSLTLRRKARQLRMCYFQPSTTTRASTVIYFLRLVLKSIL